MANWWDKYTAFDNVEGGASSTAPAANWWDKYTEPEAPPQPLMGSPPQDSMAAVYMNPDEPYLKRSAAYLGQFGKGAASGALNLAATASELNPLGRLSGMAEKAMFGKSSAEVAHAAADEIAPRPATDDYGGRIESFLGGMAPTLAVGGASAGALRGVPWLANLAKNSPKIAEALTGMGGMALPAAEATRATYEQGLAAGLTPEQAAVRAGVAGAGSLAMGAAGSFGQSALARAATGGAIGAGTSEAQRMAENAVTPADHPELVQPFDPLNTGLNTLFGAGMSAAAHPTESAVAKGARLVDEIAKAVGVQDAPQPAPVAPEAPPALVAPMPAPEPSVAPTPTPTQLAPSPPGPAVFRGDVEAMREGLKARGLPAGMVVMENGQPVGLRFGGGVADAVRPTLERIGGNDRAGTPDIGPVAPVVESGQTGTGADNAAGADGAPAAAGVTQPKGSRGTLAKIARGGGLDWESFSKEVGLDPALMRNEKGGGGMPGLFRKSGGMTPDRLREFLQGEGFLPHDPADAPPVTDINDAADWLTRTLSGERIQNHETVDAATQFEARRRQQQDADRDAYESEHRQATEADLRQRAAASDHDIARSALRAFDAGDIGRNEFARRLGEAEQLEAEGIMFSRDAPKANADLFGGPTSRETLDAAARAKDAKRNGLDGTGRTDMLSGDGELFAGPRPEQDTLPEPVKFSRDPRRQIRGAAKMTPEEAAKAVEAQNAIKIRLKDLPAHEKPVAESPDHATMGELGDFWNELAKGEGAFQYGKPKEGVTDLQGISDAITRGKAPYTFAESGKRDDGTVEYTIKTPAGHEGKMEREPDGTLQLHIGSLDQGEGEGRALYMTVNTWAARNGYKALPDRLGLTPVNKARRTEMMHSSSLRDEGTAHLMPADSQALPHWRSGDFGKAPTKDEQRFNTGYLAVKAAQNTFDSVPLLDRVVFNPESKRYEDTKGHEFTDDDFNALLSQIPAGKAGVGRSTAKRAVLTRFALQQAGRGVDSGSAAGKRLFVDAPGARPELESGDAAELVHRGQAGERPDSGAVQREVPVAPPSLIPAAKRLLYSKAEPESTPAQPESPAKAGVSVSAAIAHAVKAFGRDSISKLQRRAGLEFLTAQEVVNRRLGGFKTLADLEGVKGFHDPKSGKSVVIANHVHAGNAAGTVIHEVFHAHAEKFLGSENMARLKAAVARLNGRDKDVTAAYKHVDESDPNTAHRDEEALAYVSEAAPGHPLSVKLLDEAKLFLNRLGVPLDKLNAHGAAIRKIAELNLRHAAEEGRAEGRARGGAPLASRHGWADTFPDVAVAHKPGIVRAHPDYEAAKAGDGAAALRLARDAVTPEFLTEVRAAIKDASDPVIVPVVAREATGNNRIPDATAEVLASELGLSVNRDVMQSAKVSRGGADAMHRVANQPPFSGEVENGRDYIIVDDALTQGGTLAQLKTHIEDNGGRVILATALTGKGYSKKLALDPATLGRVRERFGSLENWWREQFGYGFDGLTESEARTVLTFDKGRLSADALRDRILASRVQGVRGMGEGTTADRPDAEPPRPSGRNEQDLNKDPADGGVSVSGKADTLASMRNHAAKLVNPKSLVFREEQQGRLADVRAAFPNGEYPPIVTINDAGNRSVLDGHNRASVAIERGDEIPAVDITRSEYDELLQRGFDDMEIAYAALSRAGEDEAASSINSQFPGAGVAKRGTLAEHALDEISDQPAPPSAGPGRFGEEEPRHSRYTAAEQEAFARMGVPVASTGIGAKMRDAVSSVTSAWGNLREQLHGNLQQSLFDRFHGIKHWEDAAGPIAPEQSAYLAARAATGSTSTTEFALRFNGIKWEDGVIAPDENVKGLLDSLEPVRGRVDDFLRWMVAKRAQRLKTEGRENNLSDADIRLGLGLPGADRTAFEQAATDYAAWNKSILDVAEKAGLIDPVSRAAWESADYIPFFREVTEGHSGPGTRGGLSGQRGPSQLKGGKEKIKDPLQNIVQNAHALIDASMKNEALRRAIDNVGHLGVVEDVSFDHAQSLVPMSQVKRALRERGATDAQIAALPKDAFDGMQRMLSIKPPADPDVVRVMEDGKAKYYRVLDPILLRAVSAFQTPPKSWMRKAMIFAKQTLTQGITAGPGFMARNWLRDTAHSYVINPNQMLPGIGAIKGVLKTAVKDDTYRRLMASGAMFGQGRFDDAGREFAAKNIRIALRAKGWGSKDIGDYMHSLVDTPAKLWELWHKVGAAAENANRIATYESTIKAGKGRAQAAFDAKDLLDFSMRGDAAFIGFLSDVLPFFNARMQGLYKLHRAGALPTPKIKAAVATKALMLMAASTAYIWNIQTDPEKRKKYDALEDWDKDNNWHFWVGGEHVRIPKPFEVGLLYGTTAEHLYRTLSGDEKIGKAVERAGANIAATLAMDPVPQLFRPMLDVQKNEASFTGRPIESMSDEKKVPWDRYDTGDHPTSEVMRGVSDATGKAMTSAAQAMSPNASPVGLSPKQLEYLWDQYTGTMGQYALAMADAAVKATKPNRPAEPAQKDLPVIGWFVKKDDGTAYTRYQTELYDAMKYAEKLASSVKQYSDDGTPEAREEIKKIEANPVYRARSLFGSMRTRVGEIGKQIDRVADSETLTAQEKRQKIDDLLRQRNALVERAYGQYRSLSDRVEH